MAVADLSERIRSINRMNGAKNTKPEVPENITVREGAQLPEAITAQEDVGDWPEVAKPQDEEGLVDVGKVLAELVAEVREMKAEIKKINKHVNWTQKLLKKEKK